MSEQGGEVEVRRPDGKFLPGVSGNPKGRPPSKKNQITNLKQDLEIAIRKNVAPAQIQRIVEKMVELALDGSIGAAKLILDNTLSNAKEIEDTQREGQGIRVVIENVTVGRETETIEAEDGDYEVIEESE